MEFTGFPPEALDFYEGLEVHNDRAYWTEHRDTYQRRVKEPMEALLAGLEPEFGAGRLFRPYRDTRFSADKTPYKTHQGAVVSRGEGTGGGRCGQAGRARRAGGFPPLGGGVRAGSRPPPAAGVLATWLSTECRGTD